MFYWTLGNIRSKYRSTLKVIHLYALVERDAMKSNDETFDRILMNLKLGVQQLVSQNLMVKVKEERERKRLILV